MSLSLESLSVVEPCEHGQWLEHMYEQVRKHGYEPKCGGRQERSAILKRLPRDVRLEIARSLGGEVHQTIWSQHVAAPGFICVNEPGRYLVIPLDAVDPKGLRLVDE